jgi:hypothetical protein
MVRALVQTSPVRLGLQMSCQNPALFDPVYAPAALSPKVRSEQVTLEIRVMEILAPRRVNVATGL